MREINGIIVGKEEEKVAIVTYMQPKGAKKTHSNKPEKEASQTKFQYGGNYFSKRFNNLGD